MTTPVVRRQYAGKTSGPRYEAWREEFGRKWIRADLIPTPDGYIASEIAVSQLSFLTLGSMRGTPLLVDRRCDFVAQTRRVSLSCLWFLHPVAVRRHASAAGPSTLRREI